MCFRDIRSLAIAFGKCRLLRKSRSNTKEPKNKSPDKSFLAPSATGSEGGPRSPLKRFFHKISNKISSASFSQSTSPLPTSSTIKENLSLTGRFLQTLAKKASNIVNTDPTKVALGLVKLIIGIKDVCPRSSHCTFRLIDRKSTRLNSSHSGESRMPSSA